MPATRNFAAADTSNKVRLKEPASGICRAGVGKCVTSDRLAATVTKALFFEARIPMKPRPFSLWKSLAAVFAFSVLVPAGMALAQSHGASDDDAERERGRFQANVDDENAASFYIIPMKGQMGTDVNLQFYKELEDDIREHDPDFIILEMDCKDIEDDLLAVADQQEKGKLLIDEFREMINYFRDDLREYRQVMWVHDSMGCSSIVAMAWPDMYMKPEGRLAGLSYIGEGFASWGDEDIRGKMREATMAFLKSFLEYGQYSPMIVDAMVRPEFALSATWKGREVEWSLNNRGEYTVDNSDKRTVDFTAKTAEDFCLSDGTADTLDDLALLLGIREYRLLEGKAEKEHEKYVEDWRRTLDRALTQLEDYNVYMSQASGRDAIKYLGKAKNTLQKVIGAINRYRAVEMRLRDQGVSKMGLEVTIEQIREQLRALSRGGSAGGGGRGGGGSGFGAGG